MTGIAHWLLATLSLTAVAPLPMPAAATAMQAIYRTWAAPRADEFAREGARLVPAIQTVCDAPAPGTESLAAAQQQWLASVTAWERLSAVAFGPLVERRSQRQIDFAPTRPRMIEKAVQTAPTGLAALELIGTPAKGLPALEWLLWVKPIQPATPECRYAALVAAEIAHEAAALQGAFQALATTPPTGEAASAALSEFVNQWVGGIERLRWANMEMPVRVASTAPTAVAPEFPRRASGASAAARTAQWEGLRSLATGQAGLASLLRAQNQAQLAGEFTQAVNQADAQMQALTPDAYTQILNAARALSTLKQQVASAVAPALGVNLGFSDADGD